MLQCVKSCNPRYAIEFGDSGTALLDKVTDALVLHNIFHHHHLPLL